MKAQSVNSSIIKVQKDGFFASFWNWEGKSDWTLLIWTIASCAFLSSIENAGIIWKSGCDT